MPASTVDELREKIPSEDQIRFHLCNFKNKFSCLFTLMDNCNEIRVTVVFKVTFRVNKNLRYYQEKV